MNYYRYINQEYGYALDIPTEVNKADLNQGGDGAYFQNLKMASLFRRLPYATA